MPDNTSLVDQLIKDSSKEPTLIDQQIKSTAPSPVYPITVKDDKGNFYQITSDQLTQANKAGFHQALPSEIQAHQHRENVINEEVSKNDALTQFLTNTLEELGFGQNDENVGNQSVQSLKKEIKERSDQQHPIATSLGKAAGIASTFLLPTGEIGDLSKLAVEGANAAREASLTRQIAGSAAKYATEGAIFSSPQAASQLIIGDPNSAAESLLWGAGLSGLLGGSGKLIGLDSGNLLKEASEQLSSHAESLLSSAVSPLAEQTSTKLSDHYQQLDNLISNHNQLSDLPISQFNPTSTNIIDQLQSQYTQFPDLKDKSSFIKQIESSLFNRNGFEDLNNAKADILKLQSQDQIEKNLQTLTANIIDQHLGEKSQAIFQTGALKDQYPSFLQALSKPEQLTHILGASLVSPKYGLYKAGKYVLHEGLSYLLDTLPARNTSLFQKSVNYLNKIATPENEGIIGNLIAKEGQQALQSHIDNIPQILTKSKVISASVAQANPINYLLGSTQGLSKDQQYEKLTQAIQTAAAQADVTQSKISSLTDVHANNPTLAAQVANSHLNAINFLNSNIPKPPPAQPFQHTDWQPSKQDKSNFLNKVAIVNDPMTVWNHYQKNQLTSSDRDTLQAVYPNIYQQMKNKVLQTAYDPREKPLKYADRLQLSIFTGLPLDSSLNHIQDIQNSIKEQPLTPVSSQSKESRPHNSSIKTSNSLTTRTQRLANS